MHEYEIFIEDINPCGGEQYSKKTLIEAEAASPEAYVKENGRFPILESTRNELSLIHILSACMLYVYSNLTLGNAKASGRGLEIIRECLRKEMEAPTSERNTAYCVFAGYMGTVLLQLSTEKLPDMKKYMSSLPQGLRIFAANVISHDLYLKGEYSRRCV